MLSKREDVALNPVVPPMGAVVTDGHSPARSDSGRKRSENSTSMLFFHSLVPLTKPTEGKGSPDIATHSNLSPKSQSRAENGRKPMRGRRQRFKMHKSLHNSEFSINPLEMLPFAKLKMFTVCVLTIEILK